MSKIPKLRFPEFSGEWEEKKLGELLKIKHGKDQKEIQTPNGKYPILGSGGVIGYTNTPAYCKESILIGRKGTIDRPIFMNMPFWTVDTMFYSEVKNNVIPKFLFYKFKTINWKKYSEASGVPSLSASTIENIKIDFTYNIEEQQKIASFFSTLDKKIEKQQEKVQAFEKYKKGMMQKIFNHEIRFKDDNGEEYPEWVERKLGDIISLMQSGLSRKLNDKDIGVPVIRSNNLVNGRVDISDIRYWYKIDPQGSNLENYFLKSGDLLVNFINSIAQIGKVAIYKDELNRKSIFTTNIMRLNFKKEINVNYIFNYFQLRKYKNYIESITKPAVNQASFTTIDFKRFEICIPSLPEQQKIAMFFFTLDKKIEKEQGKLDKLNAFKKGLLQQMFV